MQMTTENPLDLRMTEDNLGKGGPAAEVVLVHPVDPRHKGRVVHQQQSWAIRSCREHAIDPKQPFLA
jgi:hypothetical protein